MTRMRWAIAVGAVLAESVLAFTVHAATVPAATAPTTAPAGTSASAAAKAPVTPEQIKALVDQGQYAQAIAAINHLLDPKHPPDFDRVAMLMLRGECTLQLKQSSTALDYLDAIRKQAHEDASRLDEARAAALMFLVRKSPGYLYTPKTASNKTPVEILPRNSRDGIYRFLYDDELAVSRQMAKEAAFGTTLAPVVKVADELYYVQAVELIVTGGIANTKAVAVQLVKSARPVMVRAELEFDNEIVAIAARANRLVTGPGLTTFNGRGRSQGRLQVTTVGLAAVDVQHLTSISGDCDGIILLIEKLRVLADNPNALSGPYDRAGALKVDCASVIAGDSVSSLGPVENDFSDDEVTGTPGSGRAGRAGRAGRGR